MTTAAKPAAANRAYRATFIIDNRGQEESIDKLVEDIKKEIAAVKGDITATESLGKRDFVRVTDAKFANGVYVQIDYTAPADSTAELKERLRLNNAVYRIFVENR
jgi:small subunit ribosomal protein S6